MPGRVPWYGVGMPIDVPVRSPTNWAWGTTVGAVIACGELAYLAREEVAVRVAGFELTPGALLAGAVLAGLLALAAGTWLVSLYLRPGRLRIDTDADWVRRELRPLIRRHVRQGPLVDWSIRITFYSQHARARGSFKRLELAGPEDHQEVLFFTDVPRGERLATDLEALAEHGLDVRVEVEREAQPRVGDVGSTRAG